VGKRRPVGQVIFLAGLGSFAWGEQRGRIKRAPQELGRWGCEYGIGKGATGPRGFEKVRKKKNAQETQGGEYGEEIRLGGRDGTDFWR